MDEILFFQKLEKADEVAVIGCATPISERHVSLQVVSQPQHRRAARTVELLREGRLCRRGVLPDKFHELECRAGRELQAFEMVEPERLASDAYIDGDLPAQAGVHGHGRHFSCAAGTIHRQTL